MNKLNNRPILCAYMHQGTNVFVDGVNVGFNGVLTTSNKIKSDPKLVNLEVVGNFLIVELADKAKAKGAVSIPLTNVMRIDLGPEEKAK